MTYSHSSNRTTEPFKIEEKEQIKPLREIHLWINLLNFFSFLHLSMHTPYPVLSPNIFLTLSLPSTFFHFNSTLQLLSYIILTALPLHLSSLLPFSFLACPIPPDIQHLLSLPLPFREFSSPLLPPLPLVLCWEHNSRICFAASHQISVDFSAMELQFRRVDELL